MKIVSWTDEDAKSAQNQVQSNNEKIRKKVDAIAINEWAKGDSTHKINNTKHKHKPLNSESNNQLSRFGVLVFEVAVWFDRRKNNNGE